MLFEQQKDFFDVNVVNETRNQTYRRLASLAGKAGGDEGTVYELLEVGDKPAEGGALNIGNGVTDDLKVMVKVCFHVSFLSMSSCLLVHHWPWCKSGADQQ